MFDISFTEFIVIGVVALVVIGPERLPGVARTAGHLLGRARRYVNDVKSDINRELQLEELKKLQAQTEESVRNMHKTVQEELESAHSAIASPAQAALAELEATARLDSSATALAGQTAVGEGDASTAALPMQPPSQDKPAP